MYCFLCKMWKMRVIVIDSMFGLEDGLLEICYLIVCFFVKLGSFEFMLVVFVLWYLNVNKFVRK